MATIRYQPPRRGAPPRPGKTAKPAAAPPPPAPTRAKPQKSAAPAPNRAKPGKSGAQPADYRRRKGRSRRRPAQSGGLLWVMALGMLLLAAIMALPTVPIVVLGMLPTAVAYVIDRGRHKTAAICVAGLNFAGVAPFISILWKGPNTLYHSFALLSDVYTWLAMYGAAALGWLLFLGLPPVAKSLLKITTQQQISTLRAEQAKLREEWGIGPAAKKPAL
jgi:hypothetical protein